MEELDNAILVVEEPNIETPGVEDLYADVGLELDTEVKVEMPPEATDPVETTGVETIETTVVALSKEATDPQDTD